MNKSIIASLIATTLLYGCGGDGSSFGDTSSTSTSTSTGDYNIQFIQLVEEDEGNDTSCTLFNVDGATSGTQTYGRVAQDLTVEIYDADGEYVDDISDDITEAGVLTIDADDIEDGGYLSIVDSPSDSDHFYKVLSIQKELLGDYIIEVNRNQGTNVDCYVEDEISTETGYASVKLNEVSAGAFAFDTFISQIDAIADSSQEVTKYSDEDVLVRGYTSTTDLTLTDYQFVSTLTDEEDGDEVDLIGATLGDHSWTNSLEADELTALSIRINNGDYSYPWVDEAVFDSSITSDTTNFAYDYDNDDVTWNYLASGNTNTNWAFEINDSVTSSVLDISLPTASFILTDTDSVIEEDTDTSTDDGYIFKSEGYEAVDTTRDHIQRSEYTIKADDENSLTHVIYSEVDSDGEVSIPRLGLPSLTDPSNPDSKDVTILSTDSITSDLTSFFMYENAVNDNVSVVLPPSLEKDNNATKYMDSYSIVNR